MESTILQQRFHKQFGRPAEAIARAPGRVEFLGNHTDYNGGQVLGAAIDRYVWAAAASNRTNTFRLCTAHDGKMVTVTANSPIGDKTWARYPLAVWRSLEEFGLARPAGFDLLVESDLPVGAGLSSSAALELATVLVLFKLMGAKIPGPAALAKLARHAENTHVGVPCGILDQGTSAFGRAGHLVHIDCRVPSFSLVPLPTDTVLWVFNTREKHALIDGLYADRHVQCLDAAQRLRLDFLCDLSPEELEQAIAGLPPLLAQRTRHIVGENHRVKQVLVALQGGQIKEVGRLLLASHCSSRDLFENSTPRLDALVNRLVQSPDILGARLTGGGFGGAVMALATPDFSTAAAESVQTEYATRFGLPPDVLKLAVSDGAALQEADGPLVTASS
jgi:galactokinase